jgi:hypothetical protein
MITISYVSKTLLVIVLLATNGCINLAARLQPEDASVKEVLQGEDCAPLFLGIGFGTATIEKAMAEGRPFEDSSSPVKGHITKLRRVELIDRNFLSFGGRCVFVVGE